MVGAKSGFEITALVHLAITDDIAAGLLPVKQMLGFYIGGMGAKGQNYHTKLMQRMGFEEEALRIQELFFEGQSKRRFLRFPTSSPMRSRSWARPSRPGERPRPGAISPVTTILVGGGSRSPADLKLLADLVGS